MNRSLTQPPHSDGRCLHSRRITRETVGERGPQDPWAVPSPVPALSSGVETCTLPHPCCRGRGPHPPALHPRSQGRDPGLPLPAPTPFHAPGVEAPDHWQRVGRGCTWDTPVGSSPAADASHHVRDAGEGLRNPVKTRLKQIEPYFQILYLKVSPAAGGGG